MENALKSMIFTLVGMDTVTRLSETTWTAQDLRKKYALSSFLLIVGIYVTQR